MRNNKLFFDEIYDQGKEIEQELKILNLPVRTLMASVSERLGLKRHTYERIRRIVALSRDDSLAPEDKELTIKAFKLLKETGQLSAPLKMIAGIRKPYDGDYHVASVRTKTDQAKVIQSAVSTMSGLAMAISKIEDIHPKIETEQARRWVSDLSKGRTEVNALINKLRALIDARRQPNAQA